MLSHRLIKIQTLFRFSAQQTKCFIAALTALYLPWSWSPSVVRIGCVGFKAFHTKPYTLRTDSYSHLQLDDFLHWISTGFRPRFVPDGDLDNIGTLPVASFAVVPAMELCSQQEDQEEICRAGHVSHNSNMSLKNFKGGNKSLFIRCLCK